MPRYFKREGRGKGYEDVTREVAALRAERDEAQQLYAISCQSQADAESDLAERDDVIRELADALRATDIRHTDFCGTDACSGCFMDGMISAALARVDACRATSEQETTDA